MPAVAPAPVTPSSGRARAGGAAWSRRVTGLPDWAHSFCGRGLRDQQHRGGRDHGFERGSASARSERICKSAGAFPRSPTLPGLGQLPLGPLRAARSFTVLLSYADVVPDLDDAGVKPAKAPLSRACATLTGSPPVASTLASKSYGETQMAFRSATLRSCSVTFALPA